jgi:hypothetical protein
VIEIIDASSEGHAFFVGHQLFDAFRRDEGQVVLTQLRHPLPRIVSAYQWLKNKPGAADSFPTLDEFVREGRGVNHAQITQFGVGFGQEARKLRRNLSAAEVRERAQEALLERVDWFGIAEHMEESLYTYAAICGLPALRPWLRDERNTGRTLVWDLPEATTELIEEVYSEELAFFEWARGLFRERLSGLRLGGDFEDYQRACAGEYKDRLL